MGLDFRKAGGGGQMKKVKALERINRQQARPSPHTTPQRAAVHLSHSSNSHPAAVSAMAQPLALGLLFLVLALCIPQIQGTQDGGAALGWGEGLERPDRHLQTAPVSL